MTITLALISLLVIENNTPQSVTCQLVFGSGMLFHSLRWRLLSVGKTRHKQPPRGAAMAKGLIKQVDGVPENLGRVRRRFDDIEKNGRPPGFGYPSTPVLLASDVVPGMTRNHGVAYPTAHQLLYFEGYLVGNTQLNKLYYRLKVLYGLQR